LYIDPYKKQEIILLSEKLFMQHITSLDNAVELFKALGSDVRIDIIKLLLKNKHMNMNEIARELKITNGAITNHIKKTRIVRRDHHIQ